MACHARYAYDIFGHYLGGVSWDFERDWAKALEDSRHSYSLTPLHDVVRAWQLRVAAAPAVDDYMDSGRDESGFVDLNDVLGARR
ncbi:DUF6247 family protein [Streptomyces sp. NPDC052069]|uniref:DUF6247 family protein n=1 Tax=unclassified Streptomyces TaxID=2593676 RepID=UPI0034331A54